MKRVLLLVLAAVFVMLQFSCSDEGFKAPSPGADASATEKIPCIVNEDQCYEISRSACSLIDGIPGDSLNPKVESCSIPVDWIEPFRLEINDTFYLEIKGIVQINPDSPPEVALDSIHIKGSSGHNENAFAIDYLSVAEGELSYNFEMVTPIDLSREDIACEDSIKIAVYIYAGGKSTTKPIFGKVKKPKIYCKDPYPIPDFTCQWTPGELKYGKKATLSLTLNDLNCKGEVHTVSEGKATLLDEKEYIISTKNGFPKMGEFSTRGVVVCEDPTQKGEFYKDCEALTIEPVPEPIATGELSFVNPDYTENGEYFYFIDATGAEADIESSIEITNKDDVECREIYIRITGSTAVAGDTITATAFVVCGEDETEYELGSSISATVLPDPVVEECSFTNTSNSLITKSDTLTNLDTLFLKSPIKNNYGRCTMEYSLDGTSSFDTSDTLPLNGSSGKLSNITTRVTCGTEIHDNICPAITVVNYAKIETCHDPRVTVGPGLTIVEINCYNDNNPANVATNFGCDCNGEDWGYNDPNNYFTLDGVKANNGGGCWIAISLPPSNSTDPNRRQFLVNYKKEIGCVAY